MPSKMTAEIWPITDPGGADASANEDFVLVYHPADADQQLLSGSLYIIADGMGGGMRGQMASRYAAERVMFNYYQAVGEPDLGLRLREAIEAANAELFEYAQKRPELVKLSTALSAAVVRGEQLHIASVGSSRIYLVREGHIHQITRDHTLVQQLLDEAAITPQEAREHPRRGVTLRALGAEEAVNVDMFDERLRPDDVLLLCTSGLTQALQDDEIAQIVATMSPRSAAEALVQKALDRGTKDNVSAITVLLRDGAPSLITEVPHTWRGQAPSFDDQPTLAMQRPVQPPVGFDAPTVSGGQAFLAEPPMPEDATMPSERTQVDPRAPTSVMVRPAPRDWQDAPPTERFPEPPAAPQSAPEYRQQSAPAPGFQAPMQPAPSYGTPSEPEPPYQPQYPPRPPQPEGPAAYPPPYGGQAAYGQRGVPRGFTPPPSDYAPIDPVTGLPATPQPGMVDPYAPRVYQPPQGAVQRQQRGISLGLFAAVGLLAVLMTAALVFVLVNPFNWALPFGGGQQAAEQPAEQAPPAAETPTVEAAQPTATIDPAVVPPVDAAPTATPTPDALAAAPEGMALIDGGPFLRGVPEEEVDLAVDLCIPEDTSPDNRLCLREYFADADPVEEVTISPFFLDINEVTNVQYAECVAAGACAPPSNPQFYDDAAFANHPVVFINWNQAVAYCEFQGKRLPTEAEWEKAARWDETTDTSFIWPWGDDFQVGRANTASSGVATTSAVQAFEGDVSPYGIRGMAGNVSEWVSDLYFPDYEDQPVLNPTGPDAQPLQEEIHVARGGSFVDIASYARAGHRLSVQTPTTAAWLGFRCAQGLEGTVDTPPPAEPEAAPTLEGEAAPVEEVPAPDPAEELTAP